MQKSTRILDFSAVLLSAALVLLIVVDASSKSNRPLSSPSHLNDVNVEIDFSTTKNKNNTSMQSSKTLSSLEKEEETAYIERERITRKKKKGNGNGSGARSLTSPVGTSTSLRRIKKEYKDAIEMGIAYDWVNQRLIQRKTKTKGKKVQMNRNRNQAIICLGPITTNLRQWHFSFRGPGEGFYSKGIYHGRITLPKDYPLSPPSVQMWTPSGRFIPRKDICLSASNYHPESWTPRWSIQGIVNALRLHMLNSPNEIGGMQSTHEEKTEYARLSLDWKKTWVVSGNNKTKKTKVTVDHRLLLKEGVLSDGTDRKDTDEIEEEISLSTTDDADVVSDLDHEILEKRNANETSSDGMTDNKLDQGESRTRLSARFGFSNGVAASVLQLMILYLAVFMFLNK